MKLALATAVVLFGGILQGTRREAFRFAAFICAPSMGVRVF
jgi:hypothetical protein